MGLLGLGCRSDRKSTVEDGEKRNGWEEVFVGVGVS